jgi:hypothetical protein
VVRAGAAIGSGLVLALAATLAPLPPPAEVPGASLTVRLPALVQTLVLALAGVCALLLLALQRPRRPAEDGLSPLRVRRRPSAWTALLSLLPFVALLAAAWYYVATRGPGDDAHPIERAISAITGLMDLLALARKPPTSLPLVDFTVAALLLAGALALFALLVLVTFAERLDRWWAAREADAGAPASAPPAATPRDPRAEPDPRAAVLLAWSCFERALAEARAPRAPWQTPAETTRAALARLPLPRAAAEQLTALFELARFSVRPLDGQARAAACASLEAITAALASDRAEDATRAG